MLPHPPGHLTDRDFPDDAAKWAFLRDAPALDARDYRVSLLAARLWDASDGSPRTFAILAQAFARDVIIYRTDTEQFGGEDIAPAGQVGDVIERGIDDCDAKARLFVALCLAEHIPARMVSKWIGAELSHVSAIVTIDGKDLPVELTLARARLGDLPRDVPREVTGHWALNQGA